MNFISFDKNLLDKTICVLLFFFKKKNKKKLLREIGDKIQLGDRFYPLKDVSVDPLVQLLITQQT